MQRLRKANPRIKYKGCFNFAQEMYILYTWASSYHRAKKNFINQLAKKLQRTQRELYFLFASYSHPDNYVITKEAQ